MKRDTQTIARHMKVFGSHRRLQILSYLKNNKGATVGELAEELRMTEPATSQHLRILLAEELVIPKKRGRYVSYRLPLKQNEILKTVLKQL